MTSNKSSLANSPKKGKLHILWNQVRGEYHLYLMFLPVVIYYVLFKYIPVFTAFFMSLTDYDIYKGFLGSHFVGLQNFMEFFDSIYFGRLLKNTLGINLLNLAFAFTTPIIFALLLNEIAHTSVKRVIQTISYLPHFVSTVVVASIIVTFLSPSTGLVNNIITHMFGGKSIAFLQRPQYFWAIMTIQAVWKETGWGAIIYIAALTGINSELYEAAGIDGAGRLRQTWHITLPGIAPTMYSAPMFTAAASWNPATVIRLLWGFSNLSLDLVWWWRLISFPVSSPTPRSGRTDKEVLFYGWRE